MRYNIYEQNLTNENYKILYKKFGYEGIGYYYEIINELLNSQKNILLLKDLKNLAKRMKISYKKLVTFTDLCTNCFNNKGIALLSKNDTCLWNDTILINKQRAVMNDKKPQNCGRKKLSIKDSIKLYNYEFINLTQNQYDKLIFKYGKIFTLNAINILNEWLKGNSSEAQKYINKNNYGHFRKDSWVITETKKILECFEFQPIYTPDGTMKVFKVL